MKRSLYQLNFSFISVGVLTTLWWTNTNKFFAADKLLTGRLCQLWTRANTSLSREKLFLAKQREEISPWRLQCCSTNKTFEGSNKTMPDLNSRPKQPLRFLPNIGDKYITNISQHSLVNKGCFKFYSTWKNLISLLNGCFAQQSISSSE